MKTGWDQRGAMFAMTLLLMPALIALAGLVLDAAVAVDYKLSLQHATDAAALAATDAYDRTEYAASGNVIINETEARTMAVKYLRTNFAAANISTVTVPDDRHNHVRVEATVAIPVFFMKVFGVDPYPVSAYSTASRG